MGGTFSVNARACCDVGANPYNNADGIDAPEFQLRPPVTNRSKSGPKPTDVYKIHRGLHNDPIDVQFDKSSEQRSEAVAAANPGMFNSEESLPNEKGSSRAPNTPDAAAGSAAYPYPVDDSNNNSYRMANAGERSATTANDANNPVNQHVLRELEEMRAILSDLVRKNQNLEEKCSELANQNVSMRNSMRDVSEEYESGQRELDIIQKHYQDLAQNKTASGSRDNLDTDGFQRIYTGDQDALVHSGTIVPSPAQDGTVPPMPRILHRKSAPAQMFDISGDNGPAESKAAADSSTKSDDRDGGQNQNSSKDDAASNSSNAEGKDDDDSSGAKQQGNGYAVRS